MKHLVKSFLPLALLSTAFAVSACCGGSSTSSSSSCCSSGSSCCSSSSSCCCTPHTIFIPRSVGSNTAREMLPYEHMYSDCFNGGFGASLAYDQTFNGCRIARCLFGNSTLNFVGSQVAGRDSTKDILADYFGISQAASGSISFKPKIQNFVVDFNLYLGFDGCAKGLYFRAFAPLTWSQWKLQTDCGCCGSNSGCCSTSVTTTSTLDQTYFPAGYMNTLAAPIAQDETALTHTIKPATSIQQALGGDFTFGDMTHKWSYGRFNTDCCSRSKWAVADVDLMLGWDFWNCEDYHMGIYLKGVCPTGTKIDSCYQHDVFKPLIGNGRHWELGGGLSAHAELWNCNDDQKLTLYFEGDLTHMFQNTQVRSFDFKSAGAMSRYMLLKEYQAGTTGATGVTTGNVYNGHLFNAIDYATRCAKVSVGIKGDATLKLQYSSCGWNFGLGYNLYGSSKEKVCIGGAAANTLTGTYAFKGCSAVDALGYVTTTAATSLLATNPSAIYSQHNNTFGLSTSVSTATISNCGSCTLTSSTADNSVVLSSANATTAAFIYVCPLVNSGNVGGSSAVTIIPAYESSTTTPLITGASAGVLTTPRVYAPVTLTTANLDKCSGAAASQIVNKIFGTIGYEWKACDWKPFMDIGAEVDLATSKKCCSANQWGVWLRGGLGF